MNHKLYFIIGLAAALVGCNSDSGTSPPPPPPPPERTVMVEFDVSDFNAISMDASFVYSIQQGNDYFVEITIDESYANVLDVNVQGETLNVGFMPGNDVRADTLEAIIVLPELFQIDLSGSVQGTVAGFTGNTLDITAFGSPELEGVNLSYNFVTVNSNGSGDVDLSGVAAIPTADVQLNGNGSATLNLMDFATVTGTLSGSTSLFYYGSNVNLQVGTNNSSSITRLGGTL